MTILTQDSVTQILENDLVSPSVANQPHLDLQNYIDKVVNQYIASPNYHFEYDNNQSNGLNFYYTGGVVRVNSSPNLHSAGFVSLTANAINYVELDNSTLQVVANTSGWTNNFVPLYKVTTLATSISAVVDMRTFMYALPQNLSSTDNVTFNDITTNGTLSVPAGANLLIDGTAVFNNVLTANGTLNANGDVNLGNGATDTLTVNAVSNFTQNANFQNLVVSGTLTVQGTTTTINSTTLEVDDKNITLGSVSVPTNATADGGGITLLGDTNKTINWINATGRWTSSEVFQAPQFVSVAGSGTAPLIVSSNVLVSNLNSQYVGGIEASVTPAPNKLLPLDANGKLPTSITGDAGTLNGYSASQLLSSSAVLEPNVILFDAPGNYTWTKPSGLKKLIIRIYGAGGAGGAGDNSSSIYSAYGGNGGMGASYSDSFDDNSTTNDINLLPNSLSIVVGAGGSFPGGDGGDSSFGSLIVCGGGTGGDDAYTEADGDSSVDVDGDNGSDGTTTLDPALQDIYFFIPTFEHRYKPVVGSGSDSYGNGGTGGSDGFIVIEEYF